MFLVVVVLFIFVCACDDVAAAAAAVVIIIIVTVGEIVAILGAALTFQGEMFVILFVCLPIALLFDLTLVPRIFHPKPKAQNPEGQASLKSKTHPNYKSSGGIDCHLNRDPRQSNEKDVPICSCY